MNSKINIMSVDFDNLNMDEAFQKAVELSNKDSLSMVVTPNPELLMISRKDKTFQKILQDASLVVPDGIGVILAAKLLKTPLKERVPGIELMTKILDYIAKESKTCYLLGTSKELVKKAKDNIQDKFKGIQIVGFRDGFFSKEQEESIVEEINRLNPDVLFVAMGAPRQEKFIVRNKDRLNTKLALAVGGSLDVFSGEKKRAPSIMIKLNLEWLHRVLIEPKRIIRLFVIPKFLFLILKEKINKPK